MWNRVRAEFAVVDYKSCGHVVSSHIFLVKIFFYIYKSNFCALIVWITLSELRFCSSHICICIYNIRTLYTKRSSEVFLSTILKLERVKYKTIRHRNSVGLLYVMLVYNSNVILLTWKTCCNKPKSYLKL